MTMLPLPHRGGGGGGSRVSSLLLLAIVLWSVVRSNFQLLAPLRFHNNGSDTNSNNDIGSPRSLPSSCLTGNNTTSTTTTLHEQQPSPFPKRLHFSLSPDEMTQTFASCAFRSTCHVLYWHIQKSGGTNLADRLYSMNLHEQYNSKFWCCHEDFMKHTFQPKARALCQKKFGVYEVRPHQYQQVLETCPQQQLLPDPHQHTFIGLITIRQPLERTVSDIHQRCNVHVERLDNRTRDICQRCEYTATTNNNSSTMDRSFYDKVTNKTNTIFDGLHDIWNNHSIPVPLLLLDTKDIDTFLQGVAEIATQQMHLDGYLPLNETFQFKRGRSNAAARMQQRQQHATANTNTTDTNSTKLLCDFGMTSGMMKDHASSLQIYHGLLQQQQQH